MNRGSQTGLAPSSPTPVILYNKPMTPLHSDFRRPASAPVSCLLTPLLLLATALFLACTGQAADPMPTPPGKSAAPPAVSDADAKALAAIPFNGTRAYDYLKQLCAIGSRTSGTKGMLAQQKLLDEHFRKLGGKVIYQRFSVRHPQTGARVVLANMIVQWHPATKDRILLCAHYDTRPFPDRDPDPRRRRDLFLGANDGASGTALLMELAHVIGELKGNYGVDFVLFDGEELVYDEARDKDYYFLGSKWFAEQYVKSPPKHRYAKGVLLDMVADAELHLYQERRGLTYRGVRPLVDEIWGVAAELGVREFLAQPGHDVGDDHIPLNEIAKIPTCDIIDFDYPRPGPVNHWHTTQDKPENCSALSLAKVGWVTLEWLRRTK